MRGATITVSEIVDDGTVAADDASTFGAWMLKSHGVAYEKPGSWRRYRLAQRREGASFSKTLIALAASSGDDAESLWSDENRRVYFVRHIELARTRIPDSERGNQTSNDVP